MTGDKKTNSGTTGNKMKDRLWDDRGHVIHTSLGGMARGTLLNFKTCKTL